MEELNTIEKRVIAKQWIVFAIIIAFFIVSQFNGLDNNYPGDEQIYIYMGKLISEGKVPYRDFFNSHPPLPIYLNASLYSIFGFHIFVFKLVPLIAYIISALFLFKMIKNMFGTAEALLAVLLFLSSAELIKFATNSLGIELTVMLILLGMYYLYAHKDMISGIFFGLAAITGLYSLLLIGIILIVVSLNSLKRTIKLFGWFLSVVIPVNIFFIIIAGSNYFQSVYFYHLLKPSLDNHNAGIFFSVIKSNFLLFLIPLLSLFSKKKKQLSVFLLASLAYIIFLAFMGRIFKFYFILIFPLLAAISSVVIIEIVNKLKDEKMKKVILIGIVIIILFFGLKNSISINKTYFAPFNPEYSMRSFIQSHSNINDKLFGDVSIVPMMALLTERNIALDIVDTNKLVFESGVVDLNEILDKLSKEQLKFIIIRPFTDIETIPEFKSYFEDNCEVAQQFKDKFFGDFFVMDCSIKS